jgi:hypothetical protein
VHNTPLGQQLTKKRLDFQRSGDFQCAISVEIQYMPDRTYHFVYLQQRSYAFLTSGRVLLFNGCILDLAKIRLFGFPAFLLLPFCHIFRAWNEMCKEFRRTPLKVVSLPVPGAF